MQGRTLASAALAAAILGAVCGPWRAAGAEEPLKPPGEIPKSPEPPVPGADPSRAVLQALSAVIRRLDANDGPLALGAPASKVKKAFPGAAVMTIERLVPLGGSFLDPGNALQGSIRWSYDDEDAPTPRVDTIQVILLTGSVDRAALRTAMKGAGKAAGINFEADDDDPDTWWDVDAETIDIWVAIGDGIVVVDADRVE